MIKMKPPPQWLAWIFVLLSIACAIVRQVMKEERYDDLLGYGSIVFIVVAFLFVAGRPSAKKKTKERRDHVLSD